MLHLGEQLAKVINFPAKNNLVIFLQGGLGAGKTTLVRGFLKGLGHKSSVKSPTYTLVEPYDLPSCGVFHFDFYRVHDEQELELMGLRDYFVPEAICLIEWPEQWQNKLPAPDLSCYIYFHETGREIKLTAGSMEGKTMIRRLQHEQ